MGLKNSTQSVGAGLAYDQRHVDVGKDREILKNITFEWLVLKHITFKKFVAHVIIW